MKKNIYRKLKMFACYSFRGLLLQIVFVNLLFGMTSVDAQKLDKIKLSINISNVTLQEALQTIEQKSNLVFSYNSKEIPVDKKVSLNFEESSVEEVLLKLAQDLELSFTQFDNFIVVKKNQSIVKIKPADNGRGNIRGCIKGSDTKAVLPYSVIMLEGTNNGTATDIEGNFALKNVPAGKHQITISYVGYKTKTIDVVVKTNQTTEINITLEMTSVEGQEVVVNAQRAGQQSAINQQINSSSIVNVVAPDRLQQNPDANTAEALGRLPGLSLIRSGGEGTSIVIRGMGAQYSTVTLNGVELPSTDVSNRSTSVSGISQFLLQTVEVYKTITPDMDGSSVAGSINLTLAPASDTVHYGVLAEGGYNDMNSYWGNYKLGGNYSNRFFDKNMGLRLDLNAERVNRSTQTMAGSYGIVSNATSGLGYEQVLLNDAALNDITNIKEKQAATLVLDYSLSPSSKIFFYNFISRSAGSYLSITKDYSLASNQVSTNIYEDNGTKNILYQGSLRVEHSFQLLDMDYGGAFSQSHMYSPERRSWSFSMTPGFDAQYVTNESRLLSPEQLVGLSYDDGSNSALSKTILPYIGTSSDEMLQKDMVAYFNIKTKFSLSNSLTGFVKGGGKYKQTERNRTYLVGTQDLRTNTIVGQLISSALNWVDLKNSFVTASGLSDHTLTNFLKNYNFGWYPNISSLNKMWEWWNNFSNNVMAQGKDAVINAVASYNRIGFPADEYNSSLYNQSLKEKYLGTYLMSEVNYNELAILSLGARYEKVADDLMGNYVAARMYTQIYGLDIPKTPINATHNDEFLLPMIHIKVKPYDWMQVNLSYTNALTRPDYATLMPNTYINQGLGSTTKQFIAGNPYIKPELWKNYDLQVAFYNNEIGLFSMNGFYKQVKDKMWTRTYYRIKGDAVLPGFTDNDLVQVTETTNHKDPGYVKGVELEWQTSFWYLPKPFSYFSLNFNYTLLRSEIQYPTTRVFTTYDIGNNGRPTATMHRVDSTITDRILNQPNNIANISLGFNYEGFNAWLSFQFTGDMLTGWSYQRELVQYKNHFQRWDFQVAQELPVKGMVLLFNIANINDMQESSGLSGDSRPTYLESYGWTSDLGLRYNF